MSKAGSVRLIGGIEAGGTKMVCAVTEVSDIGGEERKLPHILARKSIPTTQPEETFGQMLDFFSGWELAALGIGSFGPLDLNRGSDTYGYITNTPKAGWENCDIAGTFARALRCPVGFDTDVNGAVLGEVMWGAARECETAIYITVGTGVGVGVYCNGGLLHGLMHPEAGHILLNRSPKDTYRGRCPFHGNCLEGLAAGPAIEERWGAPAATLAERGEVWELESDYIAQALTDYILVYSPQRIILWGGVMHQTQLFGLVRQKVQRMLGGYVHHPLIAESIEDYIVPPALGEDPGIFGAVCLGLRELEK